jgi:tRNA(Arg) A34 adenosine deaminase TadA
MLDMLKLAATVALPTIDSDFKKNFWLGSVGIRRDNVIVSAKNGAVYSTEVEDYQLMPNAHAEGRLLRKLGKGGIVFVARVAKGTRKLAMARPCDICRSRLRAMNIVRVYYTINENQYGVWYVKKDYDIIFNC